MEQGTLERSVLVTPELCGRAARLSPLGVFTIFQGIATLHAEQIGVGAFAMAQRGEFWLTAHTRVDFFSSATLLDQLTAVTWPEPCSERSVRSFRSYSLHRGYELVALGRTQWVIWGEGQRLLSFGQSGFPQDFRFSDRVGLRDAPARFTDTLTEDDLAFRCAVRSTDIDFGRHMNNVAYVRALLGCFPAEELDSGRIASVEVHYASPCLEGEELDVYCRREGALARLAIRRGGKAAVLAEVRFREA